MPKLPKKRMTAEELVAFLQTDPGYLAMRRDQEARQQERWERLAVAEQPLVDELNEAGFFVRSVWDLVNTSSPYPRALPILLDHLQRDYPEDVRNGIARAMAVRESKFAWQTLLRLFRAEFSTNPNGFKGALAIAMSAAADDAVMSDVIDSSSRGTAKTASTSLSL